LAIVANFASVDSQAIPPGDQTPTRNISLTPHFDQFVAGQIKSGRYHNASEVLRAGLQLLEQQAEEERQKLDILRTLAREGIEQLDQGQGIEIRSRAALKSLITRLSRPAVANAKRTTRQS
jgi:antitoxin ParD1/3/4